MGTEDGQRHIMLLYGHLVSGKAERELGVDMSDEAIACMRRWGEARQRWDEITETKGVVTILSTTAGNRRFALTSNG